MRHRHLNHQRLTLAALDDLIENGTLADWRPVLARVRHEPEGAVASRVAQLLNAKDYAESGALWRLFLNRARARAHREGQAARRHERTARGSSCTAGHSILVVLIPKCFASARSHPSRTTESGSR